MDSSWSCNFIALLVFAVSAVEDLPSIPKTELGFHPQGKMGLSIALEFLVVSSGIP